MSDMTTHRKAIVQTLIRSCSAMSELAIPCVAFPNEFRRHAEEKEHGPCDTCEATGLFFPHSKDGCGAGKCLSSMCITFSNYGPFWMALWLDCPVLLHDGGNEVSRAKGNEDSYHGNTLFPRWLAEVLKEECSLDISEDDIYDLP